MNKFILATAIFSIAMSSSSSFAQRGSDRPGNRQQTNQVVSIPENVLRANLPLDSSKLDALVTDAKLFQRVNLPLGALSELKLTTDQKKSINDIVIDFSSKIREFMQNGDRNKVMELRTEITNKVDSLLTSEQKMVISKYRARMVRDTPQDGGDRRRRNNPPVSIN